MKESPSSFLNLKTGWLCLDFINTVDWHDSTHPEERLSSYAKIVAWAREVGLLTDVCSEQVLGESEKRPKEAQAVLAKAIAVRESMYHILVDRIHGLTIGSDNLAILNESITDMLARSILVPNGDRGFVWDWNCDPMSLDMFLLPVVRSVVDLLTSESLGRVGQCADERGCGWLFLDNSKNHSRRWCDMRDCGNSAKARRYYRKNLLTSTELQPQAGRDGRL